MAVFAAVVLAAGQSTRFKSARSKVLHTLAGRPVVSYPIEAANRAGASRLVVVRGPSQHDLKDFLRERSIADAIQQKPLGTANAVQAAERSLSEFRGNVLILCGDAPLVSPEVIKDFVSSVEEDGAALGVLTMSPPDPSGYGRIVRDLSGQVVKIVEHRDASDDELRINEVNTGVICAERAWLFRTLRAIKKNEAKGEFYLTDLVSVAVREGKRVLGFCASSSEDFLGINTRVELANASRLMRIRINRALQLKGVGIEDDLHTVIDAGVKIGADTSIMPFSFLLGDTRIGADCIIENGVVIRDSVVKNGAHIKAHSVIEGGEISDGAVVGPFARIRPGSRIGRGARVGNFVELKKTSMGAGAKANHLTYLGDAEIGAGSNIGCGTITCNYDGREKHTTVIGAGAFVGSDVQFVAPVKVGRNAVIGAGSTITRDVPAGALALSRPEQKTVAGYAAKRLKKKKKRTRPG